MRPDTPQLYRHVLVTGARGRVLNAVEVQTWTQFFNKADREPMPPSGVHDVTFADADLVCTEDFYRDRKTDDYSLSRFTFRDIKAIDPSGRFHTGNIEDCTVSNVTLLQP